VTPWLLAAAAGAAVVLVAPPAFSVPAGLRAPGGGRRPWSSRRSAAARRAAELEWLDGLSAELGAGSDPAAALAAVPGSAPVCPRALAAARGGGDVGRALVSDGERSPTVRAAAACWEVAAASGAGLAASLSVLADAARETERVRSELEAGLAEPRATAWVLACLPAVGIALGAALGAAPLSWLVGTSVGRLALAGGLVLEAVGVAWSWRIAASLEASL
jgi:tight adherence protein B